MATNGHKLHQIAKVRLNSTHLWVFSHIFEHDFHDE